MSDNYSKPTVEQLKQLSVFLKHPRRGGDKAKHNAGQTLVQLIGWIASHPQYRSDVYHLIRKGHEYRIQIPKTLADYMGRDPYRYRFQDPYCYDLRYLTEDSKEFYACFKMDRAYHPWMRKIQQVLAGYGIDLLASYDQRLIYASCYVPDVKK